MPPDEALDAFLAASPAARWRREPLAGDASGRRYERLRGPAGTAILMDARAERASVAPFLRIAAHLRTLGLCPPAVIQADEAGGLLLLEDLGPETLAGWLARRPADEGPLYEAATDLLPRLRALPPPDGLPILSPSRLAGMVEPLLDGADPRAGALLVGRLREALEAHAPEADALSLRDFHASNLVWREGREGSDRLGLLDFQDAVAAHPLYDLASLLRDARREVAEGTADAMLRRAAEALGRPQGRAAGALAALAVARNLRIVGVFRRLAARGRAGYLAFLPRVRAHLARDLAHPALAALRAPAEALL